MEDGFDSAAFLASLTQRPGVYRILDAAGRVLYVGKASNLRKRVASYFGSKAHHPKVQALMALASRVEVTVTATEQEALLLECTLIKEHQPRFNVLLRDDKSYPWVYVSDHQPFPRFEFHRGPRQSSGQYLGPWPSAGAVREVLAQLQKLFRVRQCTDSFFANRSRPCLQHQIGRCTAPCVGLVSEAEYRRDVNDAVLFLQGRNDIVLRGMLERMEEAAGAREYERAALIRDQVAVIRRIQAEQNVSTSGITDADVLAATVGPARGCVALIVIRAGRMLGSRTFFPAVVAGTDEDEVLAAFISQHYLAQPAPSEIIVPRALADEETLAAALSQGAVREIRIRHRVRGTRHRWLQLAATNASQGLALRMTASASAASQLAALADALGLEDVPARIDCFDVSHTGGGETVASCVVFGPEGAVRSDYRRYNIRDVQAGDDYGAMAQVLQRRYTRVSKGEGVRPDLILVDGGAGQVARAWDVLQDLQLSTIPLVGAAKGRDRRPGEERLFRPGQAEPLTLAPDSVALHIVQQIRDEAHRFAITGHRQRRARAAQGSGLDGIPGLGPLRRRALLRQFGGLQGVRAAGVADLARVQGVSRALAERVYAHLHGGSG